MRKTDHWLACGFGMIGLLATVSVASAQKIGPVLPFPLNDGSKEWALQVGNCPGSGAPTDQAGFSVESGTARYVVRDPNKLTLNQWHHIAGVREGESLRLYVDGVFAAEDRSQPCNSVINDTGLALRVARNQATSTLPATNAVFDEVHIYPFALDDGEVTVAQPAGGEIATISQSPTVVVARPPPTTTTTLMPCPAMCGDATMDGQITATDALIILKFSVGTVCNLGCPLTG